MSKPNSDQHADTPYAVQGNLDGLIRRLKPGMIVPGRIVDCAGNGKFLLRISGYNILTQSEQVFQKFDEVNLTVRQIEPHLVFDISKKECLQQQVKNSQNLMDVVV